MLQAEQEQQYQMLLEQQLNELLTNSNAFTPLIGDSNDQETQEKITDLRKVLH